MERMFYRITVFTMRCVVRVAILNRRSLQSQLIFCRPAYMLIVFFSEFSFIALLPAYNNKLYSFKFFILGLQNTSLSDKANGLIITSR